MGTGDNEMKTIKKYLTLAIAVACGSVFAQDMPVEMKFQDYPSSGGNLLTRVAIAKGFCEKHGIRCSLKTLPSAPMALQALTAGSIDVAMTPLSVEASAVQKGAKVKAIAGALVDNVGVLVERNESLGPNADKGFPGAVQDLKGKKIGVTARGGSSELQMQLIIEKAGLKPGDVTMVAVGGANTAVAAMLSGQIDAAFTYEPAGAICNISKKCRVLYRADQDKLPAEIYATNGAQQNFVVRQETVDKHPEQVDAVIKAMTDAQSFVQDPKNFGEVKDIAMKYFQLKMPQGDEITAEALRANLPGHRVAISRSAAKATVDLMVYQKALAKPVAVDDLLYAKAP
jgi:NitT/TauT family transport system substrate-binding protein